MRVAIIGGSGFLGRRAVRAVGAIPGVTVASASRRSPLHVDLTRPETFEALRGFDLLIDLSDATRTPPDALAAWCLREGLTLLEATSDAPTIERLHALRRSEGHRGALVLGAGIFTGVSNLLGAAAARAVTGCERLVLGISSGPFSGAGASTIALMVSAMALPALRAEGGVMVSGPPVSRGAVLPFPMGDRTTLRMRFAEASMLHGSTHVPNVDVYFAPRPAVLIAAFRMLPTWLLRARWFGALMAGYFTVLRRGLLRSVGTAVQLVALATGGGRTVRQTAVAADGMDTAAWVIAAIASLMVSGARVPSGVHYVDERFDLEAVTTRANSLAGREVLVLG